MPNKILVTGAAGFIGSHLVEALLLRGDEVYGLDNLSSGSMENLSAVRAAVSPEAWSRFQFMEYDVVDFCRYQGMDTVYHLAARPGVPASIATPALTHRDNVEGFFRVLHRASKAGVRRLVYASSSSVYGDSPNLPRVEAGVGRSLSPYAASKRINEVYAESFRASYGFSSLGLRFFNVYGPRQSPLSGAVIPSWLDSLKKGEPCSINGNGSVVRDYTYVADVVAALLLAGPEPRASIPWPALNVGTGVGTSLSQLFALLGSLLAPPYGLKYAEPRHGEAEASVADISASTLTLGYRPRYDLEKGLRATLLSSGFALRGREDSCR